MKIITLILLAACSAGASDIRNVNGSVTDLSPIHAWKEIHQGERPLKAWKDVQVLQLSGTVSVYTRCTIKVEGRTKDVLLDHLPPDISRFLNDKERLEIQIKQLEVYIADETKRLRIVEAESGPEIHRRGSQFKMDHARLDNKRDDLSAMRNELSEMKKNAAAATTDLAVIMNKTYFNLEIWDFGLKR